MRSLRALVWTLLLGASCAAFAQDRPREDELFGGKAAPTEPAKPSSTQEPKPTPDRPSEDSMFGAEPAKPQAEGQAAPAPKTEPAGSPEDEREREALQGGHKDAFESGEAGPVDPLKIGGLFYMRAAASSYEGQSIKNVRFSAPTLVDGYFDARPNDQLRGMLVARLNYDPTLGTSGVSFFPGLPTSAPPPNPAVGIDQLWLRFDIARTVFVTAGRQHVHWGVGHVWAPTDYLTPQRRDPLAPFDQRLGASMLKLHVPWESQGWNFYAVGMFDSAFATAGQITAGGSGTFDPAATAANNQVSANTPSANFLGGIGGATRAEVVIGKTEVGIDAVFQLNRRPRFGVDLSSGIGPFDVYVDVGFHQGSSSGDRPLYRFKDSVSAFDPTLKFVEQVDAYTPSGMVIQAVGGASYTFVFNDNDTLVLGGEYFYNSIGYDDTSLYPALILNGGFQPFYTGRHYAALTATLVSPGDWDKVTFNFSTLGNLSDRSFISRLDFFVRVLTYLQVEAFAAVHYGNAGGEFRLAFDPTPAQLGITNVPPPAATTPIHIPAPLFDLGIGLRMSI